MCGRRALVGPRWKAGILSGSLLPALFLDGARTVRQETGSGDVLVRGVGPHCRRLAATMAYLIGSPGCSFRAGGPTRSRWRSQSAHSRARPARARGCWWACPRPGRRSSAPTPKARRGSVSGWSVGWHGCSERGGGGCFGRSRSCEENAVRPTDVGRRRPRSRTRRRRRARSGTSDRDDTFRHCRQGRRTVIPCTSSNGSHTGTRASLGAAHVRGARFRRGPRIVQ